MASEVAIPASAGEKAQRTVLGHPVGLYVLFFTEMWERFSYYGMRGLLALYMVNYFLWTQKEASRVYKWYTALVYLTPLLGGYLADRYLGNKRAVIIGALLMAVGHFLMASTTLSVFYAALVFLIFGNGFFKPNMSTQVGRLYPENDPRLDGAYTIFYMGINLGAFFSPLVCGWLADNTLGSYHSGFTAAGIGMVIGLLTYLFGQRWVQEIHVSRARAGGHGEPAPAEAARGGSKALSEGEAERAPSSLPLLNRVTPGLMLVLGFLLAVVSPFLAPRTALGGVTWYGLGWISWDNVIALEIAALCSVFSAWITSRVHRALRDRVLAIYVLGVFVVFFWAAYEQAGNVLNLWADKDTNRVLFGQPQPPDKFPEAAPEGPAGGEAGPQGWRERLTTMFKLKAASPAGAAAEAPRESPQAGAGHSGYTIPAPWFQSINALAIFLLAPLFAIMWTWLERRSFNPSIATKMALGLVFMCLSVAVMIAAAQAEDRPTTVPLREAQLPDVIHVNQAGQLYYQPPGDKAEMPYHSGRLVYDPAQHALTVTGVFSDLERDRIARDTAPPDYVAKVKELAQETEEAKGGKIDVSVRLDRVPLGFDLRYSGFNKQQVSWNAATQTLTSHVRLQDQDVKALLVAGGDPGLRDTLDKLMEQSSVYRVSPWWLFWSYILATIGELCLSPVGLSMVSKLSPARFATMLMGLWLVTSFFGNFMAGAIGEAYESVTPARYFLLLTLGVGVVSLVLFVLVRKVVALMHGVS